MKNKEELSAEALIITDSVVSFHGRIFSLESGAELHGFDGDIVVLESNMMLSLRNEDENETNKKRAKGNQQ